MIEPSSQRVACFYESKTRTILSRYGPGPRIHYHTGIVDQPTTDGDLAPVRATAAGLQRTLVAAQERLLAYAAGVWNVRSIPFTDVLDIGCGLGGGAIFWAQEFGASVTAVTIAPSHLSWLTKFAAQTGVQSLIRPLLCDAREVPGQKCFDAAVAIESCSSFPREPWFERMWALLRLGGRVLISDLFLGKREYREPVDRHWLTQIGTIDEYVAAARRAGFTEEAVHDYSQWTDRFWATTCELLQVEAQSAELSLLDRAKLSESLRIHRLMRQGIIEGGLCYALLSIIKR
jgi:tocopherol O-methyltransferase